MATFADKAALATNNAFIAQCRVAMIYYAYYKTGVGGDLRMLEKMNAIIISAGSDAQAMAWRVACGSSGIGDTAPALPSDANLQTAINNIIDAM